ncbi:hypothetical protein ACIBLA_28095 [Streptomyces sp. NPDC050433]|uniref:hypothetical protein n=1 Tax=Streptomyces sp. NPDC050433 TaxID=3365615 RepID=UPI0037B1BE2D
MSASDQEEVTESPGPKPEPEQEAKPKSGPEPEPKPEPKPLSDDPGDTTTDAGHDDNALTPRQARRIRVVVASVLLVAMAALLAVRLANRSSVLVVGLYGFAMILCGVVIELSRHGRTRLATWVLGFGLAGTLATDWLLLP